MQEEELLAYVREENRKCLEQLEARENPVLDIEERVKYGRERKIFVSLDQIKSLGKFKDIWPENEKTYSFEKRCGMAQKKQHFHGGNIEAVYMFQGGGKMYVGSREYEIRPGDLWLLGKSVYHGIALKDDAIIMNVIFSPTIMSDLYEDPFCQEGRLFRFLMENALEGEVRGFLNYSLKGQTVMYDLLHNIVMENVEWKHYHHKHTQHFLILLFLYLARMEKDQEEGETKAVFDMYEIYNYISSHCTSVTLENAAERFHYNPSTLSRLVKKETGEKFSSLVRSMRLKKSKELLANTNMRIEEIAVYVNYSNRFSFERAFMAEFQMSPKEYRDSLYK